MNRQNSQNQHWLIATDEAGYGPLLGPLVVVACVARVRSSCAAPDWRLSPAQLLVQSDGSGGAAHVQIGDSKQLFQRGKTDAPFRRSVACLCHAASNRSVSARPVSETVLFPEPIDLNLQRCWCWLSPQTARDCGRIPWYREFGTTNTWQKDLISNPDLSHDLAETLSSQGFELSEFRGVMLETLRYNQRLQRLENKATLLAHLTLKLVQTIVESLPPGEVTVIGDKFGGRNHYAGLLQNFFPDGYVAVRRETDKMSEYSAKTNKHELTIYFRAKGEEQSAVAMASMIAKFMRELAMESFNEFWRMHLPGLRPTAGYYQDGLRFLQEIQPTANRLRIRDTWLRRIK